MAGSVAVVYFEACGNFEPRVQFTAPLTVLFIFNWFDTLPNTHSDSVKSDNARLFMSRKKISYLPRERDEIEIDWKRGKVEVTAGLLYLQKRKIPMPKNLHHG
jgi:hypothetical protein